MTDPNTPDLDTTDRADQFTRRVTLYADTCELVEIAVRRQLLDGQMAHGDRAAYRTILNRLHTHQVDFLVAFLANVCSELATAAAEYSETSVDAIVADIHEAAAAAIDAAEREYLESGYLP
jgi:hypothetical protein